MRNLALVETLHRFDYLFKEIPGGLLGNILRLAKVIKSVAATERESEDLKLMTIGGIPKLVY